MPESVKDSVEKVEKYVNLKYISFCACNHSMPFLDFTGTNKRAHIWV